MHIRNYTIPIAVIITVTITDTITVTVTVTVTVTASCSSVIRRCVQRCSPPGVRAPTEPRTGASLSAALHLRSPNN